jgi:hypothetical protein
VHRLVDDEISAFLIGFGPSDILLTFEGAEAEKSRALVFSVNGVETKAVRRDWI